MGDSTVDERLVRIETKLDMLLTRNDDQEARIRALEQIAWKLIGGCAVVAAIVSVIAKVILK